MKDHDLQTDEEIVETQTRHELLTRGALGQSRTFRGMKLNSPTMESMSYLWELKNFFVFRDNEGKVARNNPVVGIAEFIYVHHADIDEVADAVMDKKAFRQKVREYINGPLAGFNALGEAQKVVEAMLNEYAAAQSEIDASVKTATAPAGKGRARAGKQRISQ